MSNYNVERFHLKPGDKGTDKSHLIIDLKQIVYHIVEVQYVVPQVVCASRVGEYDDVLRQAVAALQKHHRLPSTGEMDAQTWAVLHKHNSYRVENMARYHSDLGTWLYGAPGQTSQAAGKLPTSQDVGHGRVEYTAAMERCDDFLAKLFGDGNAYMAANGIDFTKVTIATGKRPQYRGDYTVNGKVYQGHLGGYAAHLYGSRDGKRDTNVYVPLKGVRRNLGSDPDGNPIDLFYYKELPKELGSRKNVTLAIVHIKRLPSKPEGNRILVGRTGATGGDGATDRHVHMELLDGDRRTFPPPKVRRAWQLPLSSLCS